MLKRAARVVPSLMVRGVTAAGGLAARPWRVVEPEEDELRAERYDVRTEDGWHLVVSRVRGSERPPHGPVLLQHGLAANQFTYLMEGRSLAHHLARHGFDVWVSNLRGRRGLSWHESGQWRWDWDTQDYVDLDLPAIVQAMLRESGHERFQWMGQSMGGVLLYMYVLHHGGEQLLSGVATAAGMDYSVGKSDYQGMVRYRRIVDALPYVPVGGFYRLFAPLAGRFGTWVERFNHNPENVEPVVARRYFANVLQDVAPGVLVSLAKTFEQGGFQRRDGWSYSDRLHEFTIPHLSMIGDVDQEVSADSVLATVEKLGSEKKRVAQFGPAHGHRSSYGHFDLIVGKNAPDETWPVMLEWLLEHAGS